MESSPTDARSVPSQPVVIDLFADSPLAVRIDPVATPAGNPLFSHRMNGAGSNTPYVLSDGTTTMAVGGDNANLVMYRNGAVVGASLDFSQSLSIEDPVDRQKAVQSLTEEVAAALLPEPTNENSENHTPNITRRRAQLADYLARRSHQNPKALLQFTEDGNILVSRTTGAGPSVVDICIFQNGTRLPSAPSDGTGPGETLAVHTRAFDRNGRALTAGESDNLPNAEYYGNGRMVQWHHVGIIHEDQSGTRIEVEEKTRNEDGSWTGGSRQELASWTTHETPSVLSLVSDALMNDVPLVSQALQIGNCAVKGVMGAGYIIGAGISHLLGASPETTSDLIARGMSTWGDVGVSMPWDDHRADADQRRREAYVNAREIMTTEERRVFDRNLEREAYQEEWRRHNFQGQPGSAHEIYRSLFGDSHTSFDASYRAFGAYSFSAAPAYFMDQAAMSDSVAAKIGFSTLGVTTAASDAFIGGAPLGLLGEGASLIRGAGPLLRLGVHTYTMTPFLAGAGIEVAQDVPLFAQAFGDDATPEDRRQGYQAASRLVQSAVLLAISARNARQSLRARTRGIQIADPTRAATEPIIDHYQALGLEPGAPWAEVKKSYRQIARENHPDNINRRYGGEQNVPAEVRASADAAYKRATQAYHALDAVLNPPTAPAEAGRVETPSRTRTPVERQPLNTAMEPISSSRTPLSPELRERIRRFPEPVARRIIDLAERHHTPRHILNRLLQGTPDQAVRILEYALAQRANPETGIMFDPMTGSRWHLEMSGDILGIGGGKTVFAGRVTEVTADGRAVPGGESRDVAILMGTHTINKVSAESPVMVAFQEMGIGQVRLYGETTVPGIFGNRVPVVVMNRAEGRLVTDFSRDVPPAEQELVARIVADDIARLTRAGWKMSSDIQFILGHDASGRPLVQWIDFETISRGAERSGEDWARAYRDGMASFHVQMGYDGFPSRNPAEVLMPEARQQARNVLDDPARWPLLEDHQLVVLEKLSQGEWPEGYNPEINPVELVRNLSDPSVVVDAEGTAYQRSELSRLASQCEIYRSVDGTQILKIFILRNVHEGHVGELVRLNSQLQNPLNGVVDGINVQVPSMEFVRLPDGRVAVKMPFVEGQSLDVMVRRSDLAGTPETTRAYEEAAFGMLHVIDETTGGKADRRGGLLGEGEDFANFIVRPDGTLVNIDPINMYLVRDAAIEGGSRFNWTPNRLSPERRREVEQYLSGRDVASLSLADQKVLINRLVRDNIWTMGDVEALIGAEGMRTLYPSASEADQPLRAVR